MSVLDHERGHYFLVLIVARMLVVMEIGRAAYFGAEQKYCRVLQDWFGAERIILLHSDQISMLFYW